ncbi:MAG: hypothetical protein IJF70_04365 [Opitutales bacterium]|nr:hypothetical protein [Opitutales bacterium]
MGLTEFPRTFRIYITMPDANSDILALLPLIKLMRQSRPDANVSLLVQKKYVQTLREANVADNIVELPNREDGAFVRISAYKRLRGGYPEVHFNFCNSFLDDICSRVLRADFSLAIQTSRKRLFMKDVYKASQPTKNIADVYEAFLRKYGLKGEVEK